MHPDSFEEFPHGCSVQMIHHCFSKRPSGAQQRKGLKEHLPHMSVEEIGKEPDICFKELGYKDTESGRQLINIFDVSYNIFMKMISFVITLTPIGARHVVSLRARFDSVLYFKLFRWFVVTFA